MRLNKGIGVATAFALMALTLGTGPVQASQHSKNLWRSLGIGSGALGVLGIVTHDSPLALLGVAGSAYSTNRYEQDRHHQSQDNNDYGRNRRYHERNPDYSGPDDNDSGRY